ncbi:MAG: cell division protein FtsL [Rhodobacteraceae bacterium]|nr:cell division protein FtsL [Paracoccaceae bacterium]
MKGLVYVMLAVGVMALAFWAYGQNHETQQALRRVAQLEREIGQTREQLGIFRAEWAYLNRPDRLRDLVEMNFDRLGLMPLGAAHFGRIEEVAYPPPSPDFGPMAGALDGLEGQGGPAQTGGYP